MKMLRDPLFWLIALFVALIFIGNGVAAQHVAQGRPVRVGRGTAAPAVQLLVVAGHAPVDIVAARRFGKAQRETVRNVGKAFHHQRAARQVIQTVVENIQRLPGAAF